MRAKHDATKQSRMADKGWIASPEPVLGPPQADPGGSQ
jgi:hypothetical protein